MALRIVTADERLAEAQGKTTVALFGPSGVGKTSLLKTLPPELVNVQSCEMVVVS